MPDRMLPPKPHAEGGPPASKVAPGDPFRELVHEVRNLSAALPLIDSAVERLVDTVPSRAEVAYKRFKSIVFIVVLIIFSAWLVDLHTEHCGPGARAEAAIDAFLGAPLDVDIIKEAVRGAHGPTWCDAMVPLHSHDDDRFPSGWALAGFAGYALLGTLAWLNLIRLRRRLRDE